MPCWICLPNDARHGWTLCRRTGLRDVRTAPHLWRIRAEALLLSGDMKGALDWAQRALDADRRYDDPASLDVAADKATLEKIAAALATARRIEEPRS